MALEPLRQPRDRGADGDRGAPSAAQRTPAGPRADRSARRRARLGRPVRPRLRVLERRDDLVDGSDHNHRARAERHAARWLHRARAARRASAAAAAHRLGSGPRRGVRDDRAGRLGGVCRLPVPHLLPAAEPRLLAAEDRPRLPAHDRDDRPHGHHRADAGSAPDRRQASRRDRHDARDHRDDPVHPTHATRRIRDPRTSRPAAHGRWDGLHIRARLLHRHAGS